jgi:hypothetical protein
MPKGGDLGQTAAITARIHKANIYFLSDLSFTSLHGLYFICSQSHG